MRILFLSPVQPLLSKGEPLPKWQMQASWVRALERLGHEVRVVKYTPDDRIKLNWVERLWWNLKVIKAAILDGVSSMRSARNPRSLRRRHKVSVIDKVLLGSSSMISETPSSVRFDLIIYSLGADVLLPETVHYIKAKLKAPLAVLSGVSPIKQGNPRERTIAKMVDLAATNDQSHAQEWLRLGAKMAVVLPIAGIDPQLHYPRLRDDPWRHFFDTLGSESSLNSSSPPGKNESKVLFGSSSMISKIPPSDHPGLERDIDVAFVGTLTPERRRFFERLKKLLPDRVKMVVKEFVWEEEYAGLMSRAKIGINLLRPEMKHGVNLRTFEIPAFGAMEITGYCRKEWLEPGKEVEVFGSAKEAEELVKKYLNDDKAREKMAEAGQRRVEREHTFDRRAEKLIKMIDDPRRHFFDTLGSESSLTSSSPPGKNKSKVLFGSSSMISKMPSSDHYDTRIDVSICIVNYKTDKELKRCLESIKKFTKGVSYEVIVIDNSENNRWYCGGNNLAAGQARGKYVLFLNPDCRVTDDAISELASFMEKHPSAGAAEPRQVYESGETAATGSLLPRWWIDLTEMTGLSRWFGRLGGLGMLGRWGRLGVLVEIDRYRQVEFDRRENWETEVVSGAALMVRKSAFGGGGFDERLKLYYTDVDLCRRIKAAGWEIWHAGEIEMKHKTRASTSKLPWDRLNLIYAQDAREYYRKWGEGVGGEILYWAMRGNGVIIQTIRRIKGLND